MPYSFRKFLSYKENQSILNFPSHITQHNFISSFINCFVTFFYLLFLVLVRFFIYTNCITGRRFTSEIILKMFLCRIIFTVIDLLWSSCINVLLVCRRLFFTPIEWKFLKYFCVNFALRSSWKCSKEKWNQ